MSATSTPAPSALTAAESLVLTRRVTTLSVGVAAVLIAIKGAAWIAGGSVAERAPLARRRLGRDAGLAGRQRPGPGRLAGDVLRRALRRRAPRRRTPVRPWQGR